MAFQPSVRGQTSHGAPIPGCWEEKACSFLGKRTFWSFLSAVKYFLMITDGTAMSSHSTSRGLLPGPLLPPPAHIFLCPLRA